MYTILLYTHNVCVCVYKYYTSSINWSIVRNHESFTRRNTEGDNEYNDLFLVALYTYVGISIIIHVHSITRMFAKDALNVREKICCARISFTKGSRKLYVLIYMYIVIFHSYPCKKSAHIIYKILNTHHITQPRSIKIDTFFFWLFT